MSRMVNQLALRKESAAFIGTCGDSATATRQRFLPAFRDEASGRVELSVKQDRTPAPMHLVSYLPAEWAAQTDRDGDVAALKEGIIAGFVRDGQFFTRAEAAAAQKS